MIDPHQALNDIIQPGDLKVNLFPPNSRYHGLDTTILDNDTDKPIIYLRRRFLPPPEHFQLLSEHQVCEKDRLDNLAARYMGDPELFWRICDANAAMRPCELTAIIGRWLRITLPEGVPGAGDE